MRAKLRNCPCCGRVDGAGAARRPGASRWAGKFRRSGRELIVLQVANRNRSLSGRHDDTRIKCRRLARHASTCKGAPPSTALGVLQISQ
jgi:hypothetical protein